MAVRAAEAVWEGSLLHGKGTMRFKGFSGDFSAGSRFEEAPGTNPEELLGAAHAGCFSMELAGILDKSGYTAERIDTVGRVHIDKVDKEYRITRIELSTQVRAGGILRDEFMDMARRAKENCPVSQALKGVEISLSAQLLQ